jgi:hypothetical protein
MATGLLHSIFADSSQLVSAFVRSAAITKRLSGRRYSSRDRSRRLLRRELQSKSVFIVFSLVLCGLTPARLALLANGAPGTIFPSTALGLKGAAHFVAINGAGNSQRDGAAALHSHAEGYGVSIHAASQCRGTPPV